MAEPLGDLPLTVLADREARRRGLTLHVENAAFGPGRRKLQTWILHGIISGRLILTYTPATGGWQLPTDDPSDAGTATWKGALLVAGRVERGLRDGLDLRDAIRQALGERDETTDQVGNRPLDPFQGKRPLH
jgi:hypothetical protein